jgi:dTDP-4-dehydrorhamnose 3,5-epimerase
MFVPEGFAHGFFVLSDTAEFMYKCSDFYDPAGERGIAWNDPDIAIAWPIPDGVDPVLSDKDLKYASLKDVPPTDLPE